MATLPRELPTFPPPRFVTIVIEGSEDRPALQEVSNFIYDLNLVYEIARVATDPQYERHKFNRFIWNRNGRRIKETDRLYVTSLRLGSPFLLETILLAAAGAVPAIWGIVQIGERIADWKPNREKVRLEVEKLRRELDAPQRSEQLIQTLKERGALEYYERSVERLGESQIKITDIQLKVGSDRPLASDTEK
jgi:hypothetical protein